MNAGGLDVAGGAGIDDPAHVDCAARCRRMALTCDRHRLAPGLSATPPAGVARCDPSPNDGNRSAAEAGTCERRRPDHIGVRSRAWRACDRQRYHDTRGFVLHPLSDTGRDKFYRTRVDCQQRG